MEKTTRKTERETPLNLLRDSLGKLKHENMNITTISLSDLSTAQKIANEIKQEIKIICSDIFKSKKQLSRLKNLIHERKQGPKKMIQLSLTDEQLRLTDTDQLLTPTHRSMLTYWQFSKDYDRDLVANCNNVRVLLRKVLRYLNEQGFIGRLLTNSYRISFHRWKQTPESCGTRQQLAPPSNQDQFNRNNLRDSLSSFVTGWRGGSSHIKKKLHFTCSTSRTGRTSLCPAQVSPP